MPTYEYECQDCGEHFEYFQSIKAAPKTKCEACGGRLQRLLSAGSGLIFKGSGFYITDYKKSDGSAGKNTNGVEQTKTADSADGAKTEPTAASTDAPKTADSTPKKDPS
ncbi:MAG: FmdB family zinc ribbon protein [bacterium]|nr:zinc ribbon domain-containing protein [Candidatus Sumerlaeota bacterium]